MFHIVFVSAERNWITVGLEEAWPVRLRTFINSALSRNSMDTIHHVNLNEY